ncbi:unnamed protein product [Cuscuta epithymum]|uniref:Retrotransposon Copia-like N-terminal domain-containing protein n=1 Tax=Cuscuta epithymum TaxID=186058 RepID=A0AAV0FFB2_9ASTE|nr:unnamed protein product [Cuscuta epithymum]
MAASSSSILALAHTTTSNLNLQIPSIHIKLDRENYSLWRSTVISALETFDLEDFILNPSPPSATHVVTDDVGLSTTASNPDFALWKKRDRFVLLWIKSTLSERALSLVVRATSSHMAWTAIENTFQAQTRARRMSMKVQLQTLSKGSLSMLEYLERKRSIADSLAENLHPISDEDLMGHILSGLDSSYAAFCTAFMMKFDDVSVDDLFGLLLQEEARLDQEHARQAVLSLSPTTSHRLLLLAPPLLLSIIRPIGPLLVPTTHLMLWFQTAPMTIAVVALCVNYAVSLVTRPLIVGSVPIRLIFLLAGPIPDLHLVKLISLSLAALPL